MFGNGKEGEGDGRERGRQFQIHLPHKVAEVRPDPGHSRRLPAAAPTLITEMWFKNKKRNVINVTLHKCNQCLCLCWRFYSLEESQYLLPDPPTIARALAHTRTRTHVCTCVSTHPNLLYKHQKSSQNATSSMKPFQISLVGSVPLLWQYLLWPSLMGFVSYSHLWMCFLSPLPCKLLTSKSHVLFIYFWVLTVPRAVPGPKGVPS